jgi:hypothetical protein
MSVVKTNMYVFCSCYDSSIDDVSKLTFVIAEDREQFSVLVVVVVSFHILERLQLPSSLSQDFRACDIFCF